MHEKESPPLKRGFTRARKGARGRGGKGEGDEAGARRRPRILRGIKITRNYVCSPGVDPEYHQARGSRALRFGALVFVNIKAAWPQGTATRRVII